MITWFERIISFRIPNPHKRDIGVHLLSEILREGGVSREEWLSTA